MVAEIIWYAVVSFFAIYGIISFAVYLRNLFDDLKVMKGKTVFTVVAVKNEADRIEGIVNSILFKAVAGDSGVSDNRIIVLDAGSTDETADIVKKMEMNNKNVSLMTPEELNYEIQASVLKK